MLQRASNMALRNVHGLVNQADLAIKYFAQAAATKHLNIFDMWVVWPSGQCSYAEHVAS